MTTRFKPALVVIALGTLASAGAWATEYGTVVSATPIVASVPVPQSQCYDQPVVYQQPNSGVGALIGAITGAALGHNIGNGAGRSLATGIGLVAGSAIGDRIEGDSRPVVSQTVRQCRTVSRYENRTVGYDVVYDYNGVRQHARMAQMPGDRIALDVAVTPAYDNAPAYPSEPVYDARPPAYEPYAQAPTVYAEPAYAPRVVISPWPVLTIGGDYRWGDHRDHDRGDRDRPHDRDDRRGNDRDHDRDGWQGRRD